MSTMTSTYPMIVASEEAGAAVVWHGGATFNVHIYQSGFERDYCLVGEEVDVFTRYSASRAADGMPPTANEAYTFATEWLRRQVELED